MKKLLLAASIVALSTGSAFAQVAPLSLSATTPDAAATPVIWSAGGIQTSDVDQTGLGNTAFVDQTGGEEGLSTITQTGYENIADVTQGETAGASNNFSVAANISDVTQLGKNSLAIVEQVSENAATTSNTVKIVQTEGTLDALAVFPGFSLEADAYQIGDGNKSSISQNLSANAYAVSTQDGTANASTIRQDGLDRADNGLTMAFVEQIGSDNSSLVEQLSNSRDNLADVFQSGVNNVSEVSQNGGFQTAFLTQVGNDNQSSISQNRNGNDAEVEQIGNLNSSEVTQMSRDSDARVFQTANAGVSRIFQENANQLAVVRQSGDNNNSDILQTSASNTEGDNVARVRQSTADNISLIMQDGTLNTARVFQTVTDGNLSHIHQMGSENLAIVRQ